MSQRPSPPMNASHSLCPACEAQSRCSTSRWPCSPSTPRVFCSMRARRWLAAPPSPALMSVPVIEAVVSQSSTWICHSSDSSRPSA
eukprot:scaffold13956_cov52-Phaeocystis_antarctica.AAC.2